MLKNDNRDAVKRISRRSMKMNRVRNVFSILAIVMTTLMFTTVFTLCYSIYKNMDIMLTRQQGTKASIYLYNPTRSQLDAARDTDGVRAAGVRISAGYAPLDEEEDTVIYLYYYDETEYEKNHLPAVTDVQGNYPVQNDEVMLSLNALSALGIEAPDLGMPIELTLGDGTERTFSLSGWFKDYASFSGSREALVSKTYVEEQGFSLEENGLLAISAKSGMQEDVLAQLERNVELTGEQEFVTSYDMQSESAGNALVLALLAVLIGAIIVASGYLLIYNVMYISVTKDIRFYGMLKTIGTSPKQLKQIVKRQAFHLSVYGIPIGVILGTLLSFVAIPYVMNLFGGGSYAAMPNDIRFSPLIYVVTILFDMFTVAISCRKPAKLAGQVSPVEALKYNGMSRDGKIRQKRTTSGGKLYKMAWRNIFRERKRSILVFASLFMGTMAFLSVNTFMNGIRLENYADRYLPNDYNIYCHTGSEEKSEEEMTASAMRLAENIRNIDGITRISVNRETNVELDFDRETWLPFLETEVEREGGSVDDLVQFYEERTGTEQAYSAPLISVSADFIRKHNERAEQKIDVERFERGEVCVLGFVSNTEQAADMRGKTIGITEVYSGKHRDVAVDVCLVQGDEYAFELGYFWNMMAAPSVILVSDSFMDSISDTAVVNTINADCEPDMEQAVTGQIKALTENSDVVIATEIKTDMLREFKSAMSSLNILINGISLLLILIGVINFVNVMLTGVYTRRRELAVMESVGMTKRQVKRMLVLEGAYYGLITIALILTAGNCLMWAVGRLTLKIVDYAVISYPWTGIGIMCLLVMLVCMLVPNCIYRTLSRESVTERIRVEE